MKGARALLEDVAVLNTYVARDIPEKYFDLSS